MFVGELEKEPDTGKTDVAETICIVGKFETDIEGVPEIPTVV